MKNIFYKILFKKDFFSFFLIFIGFFFCFLQNFNIGETNEARSIELPVSTPFFFFPSPLLYFHFLISPVVELGSTLIGERGCVLLRLSLSSILSIWISLFFFSVCV